MQAPLALCRGQQGEGTPAHGAGEDGDDEGMYLVADAPEDRFKAAADFMRRCVREDL